MTLRIGSLCSGYEGIGMAVREVLGGEVAWVADNDPGASAILEYRFPGIRNLGDITVVDWPQVEPVDVLCAGTPCQDVSAAGKRAGLRKGTRSGVWLEVVHAIDALRPPLVVFENVRGLLAARGDEPTDEHLAAESARDLPAMRQLGRWLKTERRIAVAKGDMRRVRQADERAARLMGRRRRAVALCEWHERRLVRAIGTVLGSLADLGYDARWTLVSAADAGAPHRRERVFLVAWPAADSADRRRHALNDGDQPRAHGPQPLRGHASVARDDRGGRLAPEDADRATGGERRQSAPGQAPTGRPRSDAGRPGGARAPDRQSLAADPGSKGLAVGKVQHDGGQRPAIERGRGELPADSYRSGREGAEPAGARPRREAPAEVGRRPADERSPAAADTSGQRYRDARPQGERGIPAAAVPGSSADADGRGWRPGEPDDAAGQPDADRLAPADANGDGLSRSPECHGEQKQRQARDEQRRVDPLRRVLDWGQYAPAIRRWEAVTGRPAPRPTEPGRSGERLSPRFVEWLMGLPAGWVTDVPGLSRNQQLHALGNGCVPQQVALALRLLLADPIPAGDFLEAAS